jgi:hypothetical protein
MLDAKPCQTSTTERSEAVPVREVTDPKTGALVAWIYRWNTGEEEEFLAARLLKYE